MSDRPPQAKQINADGAREYAQGQDTSAWHRDGLHQRQRRRLQKRARSPWHLPRWSLGLMFLIVLLATAGITSAVISLRGDSRSSELAPIIRVTSVADLGAIAAESIATETPSSGVEIIIAAQTPANLQIDGPTLPTVVITLTPRPLTVGAQVEVAGVGNQQLNVRNKASLIDSAVLFRAAEGTSFEVIGGPQQADGFTWWQLRDSQFQVEGWAVANYLQVSQ